MPDYKQIIGYLATIISVISYVPYFKSIYSGKTKPHAFSWFIWSLLTGIAFAAQISENAGVGSWVTASTSLLCFAVFILALFKGEKDFSLFDWVSLVSALIALIVWHFTKNPLFSVILVTIIDALGFLPTFKKAYYKPFEEDISLYAISALKYAMGIIALRSFSPATWLFPVSLVITNAVFVLMTLNRRNMTHK